MVEMYLRLESLQTEIQNLRGLVEEQSYQIRRLQTESRDRYLDTDSRLTELFSFHNGQQPPSNAATPSELNNNGQSPVAAGNAAATAVPQPMTAGAGIVSTNLSAVSTPRSEQELYRFALNQLLEEENFQESVNLFQQYIDVYPQGRYLTNSLYWQGAALHLLENYTQSISVLQRLLDEYPQDPKAATAMLRLGTVYNEMGNTQRAVDLWRRISQVYPNSTSEIELATEYLNDAGL
jgi:tol-pal system protein YbgF